MPEFGPRSRIREIIDTLGERGRGALYQHGYDLGEGFVDVLSQHQSLEDAQRAGRLRDLPGLLAILNRR